MECDISEISDKRKSENGDCIISSIEIHSHNNFKKHKRKDIQKQHCPSHFLSLQESLRKHIYWWRGDNSNILSCMFDPVTVPVLASCQGVGPCVILTDFCSCHNGWANPASATEEARGSHKYRQFKSFQSLLKNNYFSVMTRLLNEWC